MHSTSRVIGRAGVRSSFSGLRGGRSGLALPAATGKASALVRATAAALVLAAASAALGQSPSLKLIGYSPGAGASRIYGLSADGRSASGYSQEPASASTRYPGFLWNSTTGRQDFGLGLSPLLTLGYGISGDGLTVVGAAKTMEGIAFPSTAFRWSASAGYNTLGAVAGYSQSEARDANADGSIIVGTLSNGQGTGTQAFRWTQSGGMQGLGAGTTALAISRDGTTIVGNFGNVPNAYRWTQTGGVQFLSSLGGTGGSLAGGTNHDGSVIVGQSGAGFWPTMWVNGNPVDLTGSTHVGFGPVAVSDDGSVAAGWVQSSGFAGVWTSATGVVLLSDYLTANGVIIPPGVEFFSCTAISADGKSFAGWTTGPVGTQGYVATIPSPGAFMLLGVGVAVGTRRRREGRWAPVLVAFSP
jgi:uncharacterized membrane protein